MTANDHRTHAFVVQFDSTDRSAGRAEHIVSGRRVRFTSMEELVRFLTIVDGNGRAASASADARPSSDDEASG